VAIYGTMCPGVDSASKTEYQGLLLGQWRRVRKADDPPNAERQENPEP